MEIDEWWMKSIDFDVTCKFQNQVGDNVKFCCLFFSEKLNFNTEKYNWKILTAATQVMEVAKPTIPEVTYTSKSHCWKNDWILYPM